MPPVTFEACVSAHQARAGLQGRFDGRRIDDALLVARHAGERNTAGFFQRPQRTQNRVVLDHAGDHVAGAWQAAVDGQVQRVGASGRENDPAGRVSANQSGHGQPRGSDGLLHLDRLRINAAAGRRAVVALVPIDGLVDGLGLGPTRGGVVEINPSAQFRHGSVIIRGDQPPIWNMAREGRRNSLLLMPWPARLAATHERINSASSSSEPPLRSNPRASHSSTANRQLRTWPSAVNRRRLQSPQKGCVTGLMKPIRPRPSTNR